MKDKRRALTNQDLKEIYQDLADAVKIASRDNDDFSVEIGLYNVLKYYEEKLFWDKSPKTLKEVIKIIFDPFSCSGWYSQEKITIFLDNFLSRRCSDEKLVIYYIITLFHEYRHHLQSEVMEQGKRQGFSSFDQFVDIMEQICIDQRSDIYDYYHDLFYIEFDAEKYGIWCARSFINNDSRRFPNGNKIIKCCEKRVQFYQYNYDFHITFKRFNDIVCMLDSASLGEYDYIYSLIYRKDGNFKGVKELRKRIVNDEIFYLIITSNIYLNSNKINKMDEEEVGYLYQALCYLDNAIRIRLSYDEQLIGRNRGIVSDEELDRNIANCNIRLDDIVKKSIILYNRMLYLNHSLVSSYMLPIERKPSRGK